MSDGFSEGILYGGTLTGDITLPADTGLNITAIDANKWANFVISTGGEPVLTITAEGELIFRDASEAAEALLREWNRLRGQ